MKLELSRSFIAFVLFDLALVILLVIVIWPEPDLTKTADVVVPERTQPSQTPAKPRPTSSSTARLVPINNVDPMTGKPVAYGCPVVEYQGQIVGFCCKKSPAFNGGWESMPEAQKNAFVTRSTR